MTSPPTSISQHHPNYVSLMQISDLHLFKADNRTYNGLNTQSTFEAMLSLVIQYIDLLDLLVITGDLFHEPSKENYDHLFSRFDDLDKPYIAIAGNHDVTIELDCHLPFHQRRHVGIEADARLVDRHIICTEYWDLIFLNSASKGKISGELTEDTLQWLAHTLSQSQRPCIIFCHHPMVLVKSKWIDEHMMKNAARFWQIVQPYTSRIKGVFVGHIHQEFHIIYQGISVFGCPSTSIQFKPFCEDYTIDDKPAGLRWINLYNNATLATGIKRIDTM